MYIEYRYNDPGVILKARRYNSILYIIIGRKEMIINKRLRLTCTIVVTMSSYYLMVYNMIIYILKQ